MVKIKSILLFCLLLFLYNGTSVFYQSKVFGTIKDSVGVIYAANVVLEDSLSKIIFTYTYSDDKGIYEIKTNKLGKFNLVFTSLGYKSQTIPIELIKGQKEIKVDVVLEVKLMDLDEIIIKAEKPISIKKDTINFKTKYFADGTEQTIEDLIRKIPGINVDNNGTIKVGNQEIEKLMVDGDDLFERGYKVLSKNMPAYPIEEIELLKNYSNNRLLKGIEESNKVALNLKIDEKLKRIWFGNIETGIGNDQFYQLKGNLMNFGKKNKYYFLTNLNNVGYNATGDINNLIYTYQTNGSATIGNNQQIDNLISTVGEIPNFESSRYNFNNAELLSLNSIFNPIEKLKIKTLGFFNWDEKDFFRNSINIVDVNNTNFTNTENYKLRSKNRTAFGKLDFIYDISKNKDVRSHYQI